MSLTLQRYQEKMRKYRLLKEVMSEYDQERSELKHKISELKEYINELHDKIHQLNTRNILTSDTPFIVEVSQLED